MAEVKIDSCLQSKIGCSLLMEVREKEGVTFQSGKPRVTTSLVHARRQLRAPQPLHIMHLDSRVKAALVRHLYRERSHRMVFRTCSINKKSDLSACIPDWQLIVL